MAYYTTKPRPTYPPFTDRSNGGVTYRSEVKYTQKRNEWSMPSGAPQGRISGRNSPDVSKYFQQSLTVTDVVLSKTFEEYINIARRNTSDIKLNGSASPFAWILLESKEEIPADAIVGGQDRFGPLYVARSFVEGDICLGKVSRQSPQGATIFYNGQEVTVEFFEVLVACLQPTRWGITSSAVETVRETVTEYPRPATPNYRQPDPELQDVDFERLRQFKTVILVDDSVSMSGSLWYEARDALIGLTDLATHHSMDGVDIYFLNNPRYERNTKDSRIVKNLFDLVKPSGQTPTGTKLAEILDLYIPRLGRNQQPINIIIITDGVPTDNVEEVIVNGARRLEQLRIPERQLGIQFVQIGNDERAAEALRALDDDLQNKYLIRDMVDATPFDRIGGKVTQATLIKILTGAIDRRMDETN